MSSTYSLRKSRRAPSRTGTTTVNGRYRVYDDAPKKRKSAAKEVARTGDDERDEPQYVFESEEEEDEDDVAKSTDDDGDDDDDDDDDDGAEENDELKDNDDESADDGDVNGVVAPNDDGESMLSRIIRASKATLPPIGSDTPLVGQDEVIFRAREFVAPAVYAMESDATGLLKRVLVHASKTFVEYEFGQVIIGNSTEFDRRLLSLIVDGGEPDKVVVQFAPEPAFVDSINNYILRELPRAYVPTRIGDNDAIFYALIREEGNRRTSCWTPVRLVKGADDRGIVVVEWMRGCVHGEKFGRLLLANLRADIVSTPTTRVVAAAVTAMSSTLQWKPQSSLGSTVFPSALDSASLLEPWLVNARQQVNVASVHNTNWRGTLGYEDFSLCMSMPLDRWPRAKPHYYVITFFNRVVRYCLASIGRGDSNAARMQWLAEQAANLRVRLDLFLIDTNAIERNRRYPLASDEGNTCELCQLRKCAPSAYFWVKRNGNDNEQQLIVAGSECARRLKAVIDAFALLRVTHAQWQTMSDDMKRNSYYALRHAIDQCTPP